jgi:RNA polymerase sigma factor (sigma-70 family)
MGEECVCVVDDDRDLNVMIEWALGKEGLTVHSFTQAQDFLESPERKACGCLLLDLKMPGLSGLDVQQALIDQQADTPILFLSGYGDVSSVRTAFKGGAVDFLVKPIDVRTLVESVLSVMEVSRNHREELRKETEQEQLVERLTPREKEILQHLSQGLTAKAIGKALNISHRTVEIHRSRIMEKLAIRSLADLMVFSLSNGFR